MYLSFEEWKEENKKRISSGYLIEDIEKQIVWEKILRGAYNRYLIKEDERSRGFLARFR
jgi:hypothetical protein